MAWIEEAEEREEVPIEKYYTGCQRKDGGLAVGH